MSATIFAELRGEQACREEGFEEMLRLHALV
jgi:hypothetical protein